MFKEIYITESYKQLIEDFKDLKTEEQPDPTYLEITGYPHYENVISNILAHYFNDSNDYGMGITLVRALLSGAGIEVEEVDDEELQVEDAKTEVHTENGKFIDLVIETGTYLIGIENKIYASEYNPFDDYESYIKNEAKILDKEPVCILLSLKRDIQHARNGDFFVRVNYADFFKIHDAFAYESTDKNKVESKFSIFFEDFKQTILNMGRNKFTDEVMNFMTDNLETLNDMKRNIFRKFEAYAREEFKKMNAFISEDEEILLSRRSVTVKPDRIEAALFYKIIKGNALGGKNS